MTIELWSGRHGEVQAGDGLVHRLQLALGPPPDSIPSADLLEDGRADAKLLRNLPHALQGDRYAARCQPR